MYLYVVDTVLYTANATVMLNFIVPWIKASCFHVCETT